FVEIERRRLEDQFDRLCVEPADGSVVALYDPSVHDRASYLPKYPCRGRRAFPIVPLMRGSSARVRRADVERSLRGRSWRLRRSYRSAMRKPLYLIVGSWEPGACCRDYASEPRIWLRRRRGRASGAATREETTVIRDRFIDELPAYVD